jgi:hypothetical protein
MMYQLKVDLLIAGMIFGAAGTVIAFLFIYQQARELVAARHRVYQRLSAFTSQPEFFANSFAISRSATRFHERVSNPVQGGAR